MLYKIDMRINPFPGLQEILEYKISGSIVVPYNISFQVKVIEYCKMVSNRRTRKCKGKKGIFLRGVK